MINVGTMILIAGCGFLFLFLLCGIRILRPVEIGMVERLGKFKGKREQGFHWIIPVVDRMLKVNITEQMMDLKSQTVITKDKLNTEVDAIVFYKVKDVKAALYNVDDHKVQLVSLARTTLRAVIGKMTLTDANEKRADINERIEKVLKKETGTYGVDVLRVELKEIDPPKDVQDSMNKVVKAEQERIAAKDLATAAETEADGLRRAEIKKAEGVKQGMILRADGEAQAKVKLADAEATKIKAVNEAIQKHFKKEAQTYKALETFRKAFEKGTKYVVDPKSNMVNVMSDMAGTTTIPLPGKK